MGGREVSPDKPYFCCWLWCCCGCLPILGLIKGLILVGPVIVINVVGCTCTTIILLPHDVYYTYYTMWKTKRLGPNIKCLSMLSLLWAMLLWPPFVATIVCFGSLLFGLFFPMVCSFDDQYDYVFGGMYETLKFSIDFVKDFWDFNYNSYFGFLDDFRNPNFDGEPFDIRVCEAFLCIFVSLFGFFVDLLLFMLLSTLKFIPALVRCYIIFWADYFDNRNVATLMFLPAFIVANILLPVFAVLAYVLCVLNGGFAGLTIGPVAYTTGVSAAVSRCFEYVYQFDQASSDFIFAERYCDRALFPCFHDCSPPGMPHFGGNHSTSESQTSDSDADDPPSAWNHTYVTITTVWSSFFEMCRTCGDEALEKTWINTEEGSKGLVMADGVVVTEKNRPRGILGDRFFVPGMALKTLFDAAQFSLGELAILEHAAVRTSASDVPAFAQLPKKRARLVTECIATVQSLATDVSRLPQFQRKFGNILYELYCSHTGSVSLAV